MFKSLRNTYHISGGVEVITSSKRGSFGRGLGLGADLEELKDV